MSVPIEADYTETFLFPPSLEDFVPADDPARFIRSFVDALDGTGLGIVAGNNETGRPAYSWKLLLRIWLYGWFEHVHSSRQLEKLCMRDVGMMWLTGMNRPDHNTIWRFYHNNRGALRRLFKKSVQVAMANGLVGMVLHAVDGTKIRANASRYRELSKKKLDAALEDIEGAIEETMAAIEKASEEDAPADRLSEALQGRRDLRDTIRKDLDRLTSTGRSHMNLTDADSRLMRTREGTQQYSYNAQAVADEKRGVLVSADVTREETDHHQMSAQLAQAEETTGSPAASAVADAGYFDGAELSLAEKQGRQVVVAVPERYNENQYCRADSAYHVSAYAYDEKSDSFVCPQGGRLRRCGSKSNDTVLYECECFTRCAYRHECTRSRTRKVVTVSRYHASIRRQRERQTTPEAQVMLRRRGSLIEPIFGTIKQHLGFRRFLVRGIANVQAQWHLVCCIHNLRKLYRYCGMGVRFA